MIEQNYRSFTDPSYPFTTQRPMTSMAQQIHRMGSPRETRGFVIHKIRGTFQGKASAWYDPHGNLLDAEQILNDNSSRKVKPNGPIWQECQKRGSELRESLEIF